MYANLAAQQAPQIICQSPPPPVSEPILSKQGDIVLLDDDLVMDVYNLAFDELQKRIVQAWRNHFPNDHASSTFIKGRVIVSDIRKHPVSLSESSLAYARPTCSNVKSLIAKNEKMAKNLQVVKQEAKQLQASTQNVVSAMGEMRKVILVEVTTLEETMWKLYDGFVTVHKEVICVYGLQQWSEDFVQTLKNIKPPNT